MQLPNSLVKDFAKITNDTKDKNTDTFVYGTSRNVNGQVYVMFDGSELYTPVLSTIDVNDNDRVLVMIQNHTGTVTSNVSSPAVGSTNFNNFKTNTEGAIETLSGNYASFVTATADNFTATNARIASVSGDLADYKTVVAWQISALDGRFNNLSTVYLRATLANLDTANIDVAKVNDLYAATGLIKHVVISEGHVTDFLDTVQVNAASITAGILDASIIDVRNLNADNITVGTINGQRIADGAIDQTKLSNDLSEKIDSTVAGVTVMYALSNNTSTPPVSGWSETAPDWAEDMYMWQKTVTIYTDGTEEESVTCISGAAGQDGEDATILRIDSSRGTVFKNSSFSTIFTVVVWKGSLQITDIAALKAEYGAAAYLEWKWKRVEDEDFKTISISDPRLSRNGFEFTVTPDDVDEKIVFQCDLVI